ncbi:MAG: diguanylate cyclase [Proteobacteria bacterium]|nr:diguanylate cyclase [Pseudomonadota bacterium]MDA0951356.1 diguanylate cyclase [Pseudomonadota bacterium]
MTSRTVVAASGQAAMVAGSGALLLERRLEAMRTISQLLAGQERFGRALETFSGEALLLAPADAAGLVTLQPLRLLSLDLAELASSLNLEGIYLIANDGLVIAGSDGGSSRSHIGIQAQDVELLEDARRLGSAEDFRVDPLSGLPTYYFAHTVTDNGAALGTVVVATTSTRILLLLERGTERVLLTDRNQVVMAARESDLMFRTIGAVQAPLQDAEAMQRQYGRVSFEPLPAALLAEEVDEVSESGTVHASVPLSQGQFTIHVVRDVDDLWQVRRENLYATAGLALFGVLLTALVALSLAQMAHLRERATRDPLTGLSNRRYADEVLPGLIELDERGRLAGLVLVAFDLDHFKKVNDTWGHAMGDRVLRRFAQILLRSARRTDLVFRIGGEEFIAVLVEQDIAGAMTYAERVRQATQDIADLSPIPPHGITVSAGLTVRQKGETIEPLIERADRLLYRAKANGRNRIESDPA